MQDIKDIDKWEMVCDNDKELLIIYGIFVAEQNHIELINNELNIYVDKILLNKKYKEYYEINKNIYKELVFNYVCFGDEE